MCHPNFPSVDNLPSHVDLSSYLFGSQLRSRSETALLSALAVLEYDEIAGTRCKEAVSIINGHSSSTRITEDLLQHQCTSWHFHGSVGSRLVSLFYSFFLFIYIFKLPSVCVILVRHGPALLHVYHSAHTDFYTNSFM